MAYNGVSDIESNELLYVLLFIPLKQHKCQSLFNLALEQKRIEFLNHDRVNDVIQHKYQIGKLEPESYIDMKQLEYYEMLKLLFFYPFKFYLTSQGYHWTQGMLFMLYLAFLCYYVSSRPVGGDEFVAHDDDEVSDWILEILLWTMNWGYILYEIFECMEKGLREYFGFGVAGETNLLDSLISVLWIVLFAIRINFIVKETVFKSGSGSSIETAYLSIFGIQIGLLFYVHISDLNEIYVFFSQFC